MSTATRRRPRTGKRRLLRTFSTVLIVAGVLLVADAILTVVWQEPFSALYAKLQQDRLSDELDELAGEPQSRLERQALAALDDDASRLAFRARALKRSATDGQPVGRLAIPRIDLSTVFVEGTGTAPLRKGPGHYPGTPLPGAPGTVGIAGHRTTYGAPFRNIDRLRKGDEVVVTMPYGRFSYEVERTRIVQPTATWVTRRVRYDRLVLTACHPLYSAAQRIVVFARLQDERAGDGLI